MKAADYTILATSERYRDVAAFWRRQLGDLEAVTGALDRPRERAPGPRHSIDVPLGPAAQAALARLSGDPLGRFTAATAGIALALIRYLNRPGVLLRSPLLPDETPPALNVTHDVPLVFAASGDLTLREFLQRAAAVVEESYSLQDFPVQMLSKRENGADLAALAEFSVSSEPVHGAAPRPLAPVHFNLDELEKGRIEIDFDSSRVDEAFASALAAVVQRTLDRLETLSTTVSEIERVPAGQRQQLIAGWNRTDDDRGGFRSVTALFAEAAGRAPETPALRFEQAAVSYRELHELSNRLAHYLIDTGSDRGPIGIWMDRSPWMVVAVLGVLKAGLAYVPIDADCPRERLAFMIGDAGVCRILVDGTRAATPLACAVIAADREMPGAATNPPVDVTPSDLAYVIYTSGSTGRPKGCAIEHHSLSNYLRWAIDYYWTAPETGSMALFTPLSFDLTVPSLFCPLLRGRTLTVYPQAMGVDEVLRRQFEPGSTIDAVKLTPSHLRVLEALTPTSTDVRLIIVGGEALTEQQVASVHRIDPRIRVVNEYGPTEATVGCIVKDIAPGEPITIGRPIANMRAYVLDDEQQPVAVGVRGEICVGGAGVARGYHARPELDAARFLPDPFVPDGRIYRTGDIGRWLPAGELECFGRMDDQLKIRGYRIEPGEIEAALRGGVDIAEAVVVEHEGQLVAFVESAGEVDRDGIRAMLERTLPSYMVPALITRLARLPLTANGKIDRARLRLHLTRTPGRQSGAPPRTERERVLGRIWEEVLRVDRIGVDENFFALGGHSLHAIAMMRRIHEELGLDTSIGEILANTTIATLAAALASKTPVETPRIARVPDAGHYAVSHGQRRLWLIDRIDEGSPAYNISSAFDVRGPLNRDALADAFNALIARHESLRTVFVEVDDEPRQRVLDELRLPVDYVDLRADAQADERVRRLVAAQASRPFDLRRGPLLSVSVFQTDDDRSVLALTIHHIVSDEWSMRVLIAEAVRLYERAIGGGATSLSPLPMQYRDYAAWQRTRLSDHALAAHRRYWLEKLAPPVTALNLPADYPRPPVPTSQGRHHRVRIGAETRAKIRTLGATRGASPFMALVAIVKVLLYRLTGELDIWVGSPIAGRTHPDLANQIGFYVNTLVLRDTLDGDETFEALLDKIRRTAEEAYAHEALPFDRLVDDVGAARDLSRSPLFDVMVTYESDAETVPAAAGIDVEEVRLDSGISKFDLTFAFAETESGIDVEVEFSTDLFAQERIERMAAQLIHLAESVVGAPHASIASLDLGSPIQPDAAGGRARVAPEPMPLASIASSRDGRVLALVEVLEGVLRRRGVGLADNFFFIGGDSIRAVQVVNRLARKGWTLRVRDLFEAPGLGDLAARMQPAGAAARPLTPAAGDVPLTPIQQWFFETTREGRSHFNQSVMLRFEDRIDETALRSLGHAVVAHHDALRLRYRIDGEAIRQFHGEAHDPVDVRDLRAAADPVAELERQAAGAQASLDLERGPLARWVLFRMPDGDRLLAVIHHLVVDGVSWRILLEDLRRGLAQAARGEPVDLGEKSQSYQAWARALQGRAAAVEGERSWWDAVARTPVRALPYDSTADVPALEANAREQRMSIGAGDTRDLLSRVHQAYNTRTNDVLLAALTRALHDWAGPGATRLDIEAHGRDALHDVDVSRTVGWFTTLYPILLDGGGTTDHGELLKDIKESLRAVPGRGVGYGLLRAGRASGAPILFNFLGQFDTDMDGLEMADEPRGPEHGPLAPMTHDLVIGGWIAEGRLHLTARYAPARFSDETIGRLLEGYRVALETLIEHCRKRSTHVRTLSDYRYADPTTAALAERLGTDRVDDIYPLSPMQQGLLYHSVLETGSPVYVEQFTCVIRGALDAAAFRAAWDRIIARHTALRTAIAWEQVEQPVQVVLSAVDAPWTSLDLRALSPADQAAHVETFAAEDRRRGFALTAAPLMRFALVQVDDNRWRFYWTWHHIVLDGWSTAIVLQEVFRSYEAAVAGTEAAIAPARPFGDYIDWLRAEDGTPSSDYWRARLEGFSTPTPLPAAATSVDPGPFAVAELSLSETASARVAASARDHGLTLNTLARGAWALVLGAHARQDDVVFGATVAGRPASLRDVESMVGLFINTVPIRVRIDAGAPFAEWLRGLQLEHADLDRHAYGSLADIQRLSGVPARMPLFESILVFENFPVDQSLDPEASKLSIDATTVAEQTNYPLTISVVPGDRLLLRASYDTARYDEDAALAILHQTAACLTAFADDPARAVASAIERPDAGIVRSGYELDDATLEILQTIAARDAAPPGDVLRALAVVLCFRYAAHEDLLCTVDYARVSRENLRDDDTFAATLGRTRGEGGASDADLAFGIADHDGRLGIEAVSATGRFDEAFLQRTRDHVAAAAAAVLTDPQAPIGTLPLLPSRERQRLVVDFNRTARDWGPERTIAQFFEARVAAHPDRVAVLVPAVGRDDMDGDAAWTYGELNARANQLARALTERYGVGPDVRVGVLAERSFEMVVALMAIEKAGGAYVPLDPEYPLELLRFMMEDCGAAAILAQHRFLSLAKGFPGPVVDLDAWSDVAHERTDDLPSRVTGDHLAYVIYTSGSTGRPKGAMNTHRGIANRLLWMQDAYGLTEGDRVLQKTPFSFDVSVWEFFWPLMTGAGLVLAKPGGHRDAAYLVSLIRDARITTLHFVPSMLQAFIEEPNLDGYAGLTRVICSGEAMTPELLRRYLSRLDAPLHNLYGPTEAAVDVTAWTCGPADVDGPVPIGRPIANTQLYILDRYREPVPEGVTGELVLGGDGVGRGYLNRPDLTAEKFIDDAFRESPDARLYRTGDLARYRADAVVDFLGRIDHQVKLRGFRIELGEIESAILSHPGIRECVVIVREDQPGAKRLVAYVVLRTADGRVPNDLRPHMERALPMHMVPGVVVPMGDLPRLTNGKIDRKALPPPEDLVTAARRRVAPRDGVERRLLRVWEDVLGTPDIGVTDDFFDLGGHSILAVKLASAIHREFRRALPLAELLSHSTIERLAVLLQRGEDPNDWRPLVEIRRGSGATPLFLLPGAGGNVIYFHALARHLAAPRPVYGLQAVGLDGRTAPMATVEAIAEANIREMRRIWPHGPYLLAGHSFGGRVALEMAQQLTRLGLVVGLVCALDTAAPSFDPASTGSDWQDAHWLVKIAREIEEYFGVRLDVTLDELMPLPLDAQLALIVERMQRAGAWAPGAYQDELRGYLRVYKANTQAPYVRYESVARVPIALFKASEKDPDFEPVPSGLAALTAEEAWGWDRFSSRPVSVFEVPGSHLSMLSGDNAAAAARAIDEALAEIDE